MDGGECVSKVESNIGMEEGELEDGELDDTVDDITSPQAINQSQIHEDNVSQSPSFQDRKKKSKKRKREETDKGFHSNDGKQSPIDCETFPYHKSWGGNSFGRNNQNVTQRGPYDSPNGSECDDDCDNLGGFSGRQYSYQNDNEGHVDTQRMKRQAEKRKDRHRGKKVRRVQGSDSNYFEDVYNDSNDKREATAYKSDATKSFKSKKKKFNSVEKFAVCKYFLEGKCFKGEECSFSHCIQKKADLCKHYLVGNCRKNPCQFYHGDWPCKDFHLKGECGDGDFCKFSHEELTQETENLLYTSGNTDDSGTRRSSTEDFQNSNLDNRKKIPSLLDIEIFPPGHVPKRPSPHGGNFRGRPARGNKFNRGQKKGCPSNVPFDGPSFGGDNQRSHGNNFMKRKQGWGRKPYDMDWCKKEEFEEMGENEEGGSGYYDQQYDDDCNFNDRFENDVESSSHIKNQPFGHEINRANHQDHNDYNAKGQGQMEENRMMTDFNESSDKQISNNCLRSPDVRPPQHLQQSNIFQNNLQIPNVLGMTHPIMRVPPPNILPMQTNVIRSMNRPVNPVTCSQLGILGAAPSCPPIQMPHRLAPHNPPHLNLPQQGIQSPQPIINQFVPPHQPLVGLLGRNPRPMFQPNMNPVNNQPFLQLPPFPPPRFDFNQIIRNIVRNTLSTQFMVKPPSPISVPVVNDPQVLQSTDIDRNVVNTPINNDNNDNIIITTNNNNNNNNNNTSSVKPGTDPRLKSKDDKTEITEEENDNSRLHIAEEVGKVPEIDGTAKQMEYCLRPFTFLNSRPSLPTELLMNFKDDLSSCEDPRLKKYSRSLSDLKLDSRKKLNDPRSHKKEIKIFDFSSPPLLSPTDVTNKPYTLPDIFIPPTSAPNIELEEKALSGSGRIKLRKNSSPIFFPTRDLTMLFSNPHDVQSSASTQSLPLGSPTGDNKLFERGHKRVVDYRNDPRFKKKKLSTAKNEDADKSNDPETSDDISNSISSIATESVVEESRIPSPIPTFPRYCSSYESTGLFVSSSNEELEDVEGEGKEVSTESDADDALPPSQSPLPFFQENPAEMMEGVNLKDMFKTIDPTTSPFC